MKISNRKSKGSQFEMSVRDSLAQKYPDVLLTKQEGFVSQYDIFIPSVRIIIECKRHKGFSWNELEKYFLKLEKRVEAIKDEHCIPYLIFQGNHQPCLVMLKILQSYLIKKFKSKFDISFIKQKGNRK